MWPAPKPAGMVSERRRRLHTRDYTVGWICALPIELAAAQEMLDEVHEPNLDQSDTLLYNLGRIHGHNVVIACLPAGTTGTQSAATVAARMRSRFSNIKFGLMVGIGGGVPSVEQDIRLGDVVVSHPYQQHGGVVQYDFGKTMTKGHTRTGWLNAPPPVLLSAIVEQRARSIRRQSTLENHLARFNRTDLEVFNRQSAGPDWLFNATYEHPGGSTCRNCSNVEKVQRPGRRQGVNIFYGTIASGNQVMRDGVKRDEISKELGGVMCFEMEAAGLMNDFPCLVVRGICDYADSHKNKTWQPYAAATAAACAKEILTIVPSLPEPAPAPSGHDPESGQTRVEMKLDLLLREWQLGYRSPGQIVQDIKKDLVDDNVTEVDVEENREFIDEWLKSTEADGRFEQPIQERPRMNYESMGNQPTDRSRSPISTQDPPYASGSQARYDDVSDEDNDNWSNKDNYLLSDAETEVADEHRVPINLHRSNKTSYPHDTQQDLPVRSRSRHEHVRLDKKTPLRKPKANARDRAVLPGNTYYPQSRSRSPSPVQRRPRRKPHGPQTQHDGPYIPAQPKDDPYYPNYQPHQRQSQLHYGGSPYANGPGAYERQPVYGNIYNSDHEPAAPPLGRPPIGNENRYTDGYYDRDGYFVRYGNAAPYRVSYDSQPRPSSPPPPPPPPPPPDAYSYRTAEQAPRNPFSHDDPPKTFHFSTRDSGPNGFQFSNPESIFAEFLRAGSKTAVAGEDDFDFSGFGTGGMAGTSKARPGRSPSQNRPLEVTIVEKPLPVTLEEMFSGTTKKLKIKRKTYDQATGKTSTQDRILEVPIKMGLKAGSKIKFSDVGDQVEGGTQDLHFIVTEVPEPHHMTGR